MKNSSKSIRKPVKPIETGKFTKEDTQMSNKHMKVCSTSFVFKEVQIETIIKVNYTFSRTVYEKC